MYKTQYELKTFFWKDGLPAMQLEEYLNKHQPKDYRVIQWISTDYIAVMAEFEKGE